MGAQAKIFNHQTRRDNVALIDEALLQEINALVAAHGRALFKKKKALCLKRWSSRATPMCWRATYIFPPI